MTTESAAKGLRVKKPTLKEKSKLHQILVYLFVIAPTLALIAAIVCGWGPSLHDVVIGVAFFAYGIFGISAGYHRLFTHKGFVPKRWLKIQLAIAGMFAFQGAPLTWVADHRRHHLNSDQEDDPHSPWKYGTTPWALVKGFWHAHMGWLFNKNEANAQMYARDLVKDDDIRRLDRWFKWICVMNLVAPAVIGGLWSWSLWGAVTAFFWAGLVRVAFVHHTTWSINSICHMTGKHPYNSGDEAGNVWWLAPLSFGESWHNNHHADETCARHGVDKGQIDITARILWIFEKFGWIRAVRWPNREKLDRNRSDKSRKERQSTNVAA